LPALAQSRARVPLVASAPVQDLRFRAKVLLGGAKVVRAASGRAAAASRLWVVLEFWFSHWLPPAGDNR